MDIGAQEQADAAIRTAFAATRPGRGPPAGLRTGRVRARGRGRHPLRRAGCCRSCRACWCWAAAVAVPLACRAGGDRGAGAAEHRRRRAGDGAAVFGFVHGIALGFGMTMLGVTVDYPVLLIGHRKAGRAGRRHAAPHRPRLRPGRRLRRAGADRHGVLRLPRPGAARPVRRVQRRAGRRRWSTGPGAAAADRGGRTSPRPSSGDPARLLRIERPAPPPRVWGSLPVAAAARAAARHRRARAGRPTYRRAVSPVPARRRWRWTPSCGARSARPDLGDGAGGARRHAGGGAARSRRRCCPRHRPAGRRPHHCRRSGGRAAAALRRPPQRVPAGRPAGRPGAARRRWPGGDRTGLPFKPGRLRRRSCKRSPPRARRRPGHDRDASPRPPRWPPGCGRCCSSGTAPGSARSRSSAAADPARLAALGGAGRRCWWTCTAETNAPGGRSGAARAGWWLAGGAMVGGAGGACWPGLRRAGDGGAHRRCRWPRRGLVTVAVLTAAGVRLSLVHLVALQLTGGGRAGLRAVLRPPPTGRGGARAHPAHPGHLQRHDAADLRAAGAVPHAAAAGDRR